MTPPSSIIQKSGTYSQKLDFLQLNSVTVTINCCRILNAETGPPISASVQYISGTNKIIFTLSPGLNYFIENRSLTAQAAGVTDRFPGDPSLIRSG